MKPHSHFPPPYPYQQRTIEVLLKGRPVVLQAPTGAGKTRAAYQCQEYLARCMMEGGMCFVLDRTYVGTGNEGAW